MSFDLGKVGTTLKVAREGKGLSLQEVADVLFIRRRIIDAIEGGQWENLPHEVYVKGYVTQYAAFLGVESSVAAELAARRTVVSHAESAIEPAPRHPEKSHWQIGRRLIGSVAVVVIAGGFLVYQNMDNGHSYVAPPQHKKAFEAQPAVMSYQTVATNAYADEVQGEKIGLEAKKLMIACQQRTWVRIVIDGSERKEFTMNPEEVLVLDGREGFDLLIGNAGGIKLFYNGKDTGFEGSEGEVKRISLS